ncbi:amidohydrolase family protein [Streptomyces sp. I05A-00742]|uniref:amidohydrolase family protein n=1 Tax=Streptomyces sp. I05A-00742 TaxID=2732853 RepID=UPI001489F106|nr:amidohydrolase family protein [Streptomyces sp. I05A-00742]
MSTAPSTGLLFRDGYVYPADAGAQVLANGSVLVVGDRIAAVGTAADVDAAVAALEPAVRDGLRTVDARRSMILPGLVNPHWHELFAMRIPFKGALRPPHDRDDVAAFMALGGDLRQISVVFDSFHDQLDSLTPDEAEAIARYSMWTQLRTGVTTLGDVGSFNRPDAMADAALGLGIRFMASTWASDAVCAPGETRFRRTRDADGVLAGVQALLDRCAADTSGRLRARPSAVYGTNMTDELGRGFAELVERYDVPFAAHIGALRNEAEVMSTYFGATPVRRFAELGLVTDRLMSVHTGYADEEERKLLLAAGAHLNHSPAKYGGAGETTLTDTRMIPELRRAGLDVSLSTDGTALPIGGMAEAMRAAWQMFNEMSGDPTEVLPTDALAMATRIPAKGLRWDDEIGSLEPGKQADLVTISLDDWRYLLNPRPLESFLALGGSMDIDTVVVAGEVLLEGGRSTRLDERQLKDDYLEALGSFSVRSLGIAPDVVQGLLAKETTR